jgi:hypothetical protein
MWDIEKLRNELLINDVRVQNIINAWAGAEEIIMSILRDLRESCFDASWHIGKNLNYKTGNTPKPNIALYDATGDGIWIFLYYTTSIESPKLVVVEPGNSPEQSIDLEFLDAVVLRRELLSAVCQAAYEVLRREQIREIRVCLGAE